jgi:hypothetical protein
MGWFYLDDPNGRDLVADWKERPGMVGLRFYFNERHKREWVTDGTLDWLWPAAERAGVPVALAAALFPPTVGQIAERPERMFCGTDITWMPCSWRQRVTVFTEELPWLKGRDLELVMGEAVCNWVGWSHPA